MSEPKDATPAKQPREPVPGQTQQQVERKARLAAALRENLRRRKAGAKAASVVVSSTADEDAD